MLRPRLLFPLLLAVAACAGGQRSPSGPAATDAPRPPIAAVRPHPVASPNGTRNDPYYWLRDDSRKSEEVLGYLRAENAYTDAMLAPTAALQEKIYREITGRIEETDQSVPVLENGYWYYHR